MNKTAILSVVLCLSAAVCMAQETITGNARLAIATNITDYIYLLTPNVDVQYSVGRCVSAQAGMKYNNWSFGHGTQREVKNRQQTYYAGVRWWPWYTFSGWWMGSAVQFEEYDTGGVLRKDSEAGNAYGLSLSAGYSLQLVKWLNLDIGAGVWGGRTNYTLYACPYCGKKLEEGEKFFVLPNEARIALQFIF